MQDSDNNRIVQAIKNRDLEELRWSEAYLELKIEDIYKNFPKNAAKQEQKKLKALLGNVHDTIISLDTTLYDRWIISLFDRDEAKGD